MHYPHHLLDLLVLLAASVSVAFFSRLFRISRTLGYLIAGVLIGPYFLQLLPSIDSSKVFSDFGLMFLLFTIGLELPFHRLQALRKYVFGLGALQVFITAFLFYLFARTLGFNAESSIAIGLILSLSSTSVVLQILSEKGELHSRFGRVTFSVLLFQDLMVVILLVSISFFRDPSTGFVGAVALPLIKSLVGLGCVVFVGRLVLRPLYKHLAVGNSPDLFMGLTLLVILSISYITASVGISMELGAFLAGMLLAETEYRQQVEEDIRPFRGLLLGIFFMTIGMSIDPKFLLLEPYVLLFITFGMMIVKILVMVPVVRLFKTSWDVRLKTAFLLAPGGEFVFVLVYPAQEVGILTPYIAQVLATSAALSMMFTPFLYKIAHKIGKKLNFVEV